MIYAISITQPSYYFLVSPKAMLTTTNSFTQSRLHLLEEYAGCRNLDLKKQKGTHRFLFSVFRTVRSAILPHYNIHFTALILLSYYCITVAFTIITLSIRLDASN